MKLFNWFLKQGEKEKAVPDMSDLEDIDWLLKKSHNQSVHLPTSYGVSSTANAICEILLKNQWEAIDSDLHEISIFLKNKGQVKLWYGSSKFHEGTFRKNGKKVDWSSANPSKRYAKALEFKIQQFQQQQIMQMLED